MGRKSYGFVKLFLASGVLAGLCLASLKNNFSESPLEKELKKDKKEIIKDSLPEDSLDYIQDIKYFEAKENERSYYF